MLTFDKVMERLRASINYKNMQCKEFNDKQTALILDITPINYATMKKRGKTPYKNIIDCSNKNKLDLNYIFQDNK